MVSRRESKRARMMLDARLAELPSAEAFAVPRGGWVRSIRDALGMSAAELGRRLGVAHSSVFDLERSERAGSVRLDTLRRAADALDCTLVYAFVPNRGLEATVRARAEELADDDLRAVDHTMALEDQKVETPPHVREELVQQLAGSRELWSRRP